MIGEAERRRRFSYALQQAMRERNRSARDLARELEIDPRRVGNWLKAKRLPDLYEARALADTLGVSEELFRNPPEVPEPPPYPLEQYLLDAVGEAVERGLRGGGPEPQGLSEPGSPPHRPRPKGDGR